MQIYASWQKKKKANRNLAFDSSIFSFIYGRELKGR